MSAAFLPPLFFPGDLEPIYNPTAAQAEAHMSGVPALEVRALGKSMTPLPTSLAVMPAPQLQVADEKPSIRTHQGVRDVLDEIRIGKELNMLGKPCSRPEHFVNRDLWKTLMNHLLARGEVFRAPYPYYLDNVEHTITRLDSLTPELARTLRRLGFLDGEKHTLIVQKNLKNLGGVSELRPLHRLAYFADENIYLNMGGSRMLKVGSHTIDEVPLGTDGVVLIAPEVGGWPPMEELQPHIETLRPQLGEACTRLMPKLPMTRLLTTRWSHHSVLSPDEAHQMFLTRFLFTAAASRYSLWPLALATGEEDSGKSTAFELLLTLLRGKKAEAVSLPYKETDLIASATNRGFPVYDNIDGANLEDPKRNNINDLICGLSTGAEIDMRKLYVDNQRLTYNLQNHVAFTARVCPFPRSDVIRRTLTFEMEPSDPTTKVAKDDLFNALLAERPALLAEYVLRAQNILKAHLTYGEKKYSYQSSMAEYEKFTLVCAEYEGMQEATKKLWYSYLAQYREAISASNPMVFAIRLWLGSDINNAERKVSPSTLFAELQNVFSSLNQKFIYTAPNAFGAAIGKQRRPLSVLGLADARSSTARTYWFNPSPEELAACRTAYKDLLEAICSHRSFDEPPL